MLKKKILIIGDEAPFDNVLQAILLDELTCDVDIYYLTDNLQNYIEYNGPNLIIATSGFQEYLLRKIKENQKLEKIPIILLSGYYSIGDVLASVADDFLSKPINIPIFLEKVRKWL